MAEASVCGHDLILPKYTANSHVGHRILRVYNTHNTRTSCSASILVTCGHIIETMVESGVNWYFMVSCTLIMCFVVQKHLFVIQTRIGVFAQGQILCISTNGLQAGHCDAPPPHFGWKKITSDRISRHFRSMHNFLLLLILFRKWLPVAIFDERKSLSIAFFLNSQNGYRSSKMAAFLAISDQYAIFVYKMAICNNFIYFFKWLLTAILEVGLGLFWMTENHCNFCFHKMAIKWNDGVWGLFCAHCLG